MRTPRIEIALYGSQCYAVCNSPLVAGTHGMLARVHIDKAYDGLDEVWVCWRVGDNQVDQRLDPDNPILEVPDELLEVPGEVLTVGAFARGVRDGRRMTIPSTRVTVGIIRSGTADHPHQ